MHVSKVVFFFPVYVERVIESRSGSLTTIHWCLWAFFRASNRTGDFFLCVKSSFRFQVQFTCEVRSVPATNTNRFPVIFALRTTMAGIPSLLPAEPNLPDPLIVTLTYFRRTEFFFYFLFSSFNFFHSDRIKKSLFTGSACDRTTVSWSSIFFLSVLIV